MAKRARETETLMLADIWGKKPREAAEQGRFADGSNLAALNREASAYRRILFITRTYPCTCPRPLHVLKDPEAKHIAVPSQIHCPLS